MNLIEATNYFLGEENQMTVGSGNILEDEFGQYVVYSDNKIHILRFPNGYGASVVKDPAGRDRIEVGLVKFFGEGDDDYDIVYDTKIRGFEYDAVYGCYSIEDLHTCLTRIKSYTGNDGRYSEYSSKWKKKAIK